MYKFAIIVLSLVVRLLRHFQVEGKENIPSDGGCILAANHTSFWDPIFLGIASPRTVRFMAKKSLFDKPFLGFLFKHLQAFPVTQASADHHAIKTALEILKSQQVLGIFPEGTRSKTGLLSPKLGIALLASKAQVPIIPIAIWDQKGFRGHVKVNIGKPILPFIEENAQLTRKEQLNQYGLKIMQEVAKLLQENLPDKAN